VIPAVVAGLFGVVGVVIGVLGTVFVARYTAAKAIEAAMSTAASTIEAARSTAASTIEADRRNRVWEKQSQVYIDAVAGILHLVKVRHWQWQRMTTDTEPEHPPAPVDWPMVEAGLIAYASDDVLDALKEARIHGSLFDAAFRTFLAANAASSPPRTDPQASQLMDDAMKEAKKEFPEALRLCNDVMDIIRKELYAGPGGMHAPQKKENITEMARHEVGA